MNDQTPNVQSALAGNGASDADPQRSHAIAPCIELSPDVAVARILSALSQGEALPYDAFVQLAERNRALLNATEDEVATSLARQVVVLEALFLSFAAKAANTHKVDHSVGLTKAATNVHRSLLAAQGALRQVSEDRRNAEAIEA